MRSARRAALDGAMNAHAFDIGERRMVSLIVMTATSTWVRSYLPKQQIGTNHSRNAEKAFRETGARVM